jgi:hypothetical protein
MVNDKGRYRQEPQIVSARNFSSGVACDRNSDSIVHCILKLLFAANIPFRRLHRSVATQKLDLFQFASGAVDQECQERLLLPMERLGMPTSIRFSAQVLL